MGDEVTRQMLMGNATLQAPRVPRSARWDNYIVLERGFGLAPNRITVTALSHNELALDRDPANDEWALYVKPSAQSGLGRHKALSSNKPDTKALEERVEALQTTVNLLKSENAMLHKIVERLAQRMDRLEFNAELGDEDYVERYREEIDAGGNEEPTAAGSDGEPVPRPEGESISIGDAA